MEFGCLAVLWLDNTLKLPYINIENYPVVAGYDETGQELYVAGVFTDNNANWDTIRLCTTRKDADCVTFFDTTGVKRRAYRFHILVLRYDKNHYEEQLHWDPTSN